MEKYSCDNCKCKKCMFNSICCDYYDCTKEGYRNGNWFTNHKSDCEKYRANETDDKNIGECVFLFENDFENIASTTYLKFFEFYKKLGFDERIFNGIITEKHDGKYRIQHIYGLGNWSVHDWSYDVYITNEELEKIKDKNIDRKEKL